MAVNFFFSLSVSEITIRHFHSQRLCIAIQGKEKEDNRRVIHSIIDPRALVSLSTASRSAL